MDKKKVPEGLYNLYKVYSKANPGLTFEQWLKQNKY